MILGKFLVADVTDPVLMVHAVPSFDGSQLDILLRCQTSTDIVQCLDDCSIKVETLRSERTAGVDIVAAIGHCNVDNQLSDSLLSLFWRLKMIS